MRVILSISVLCTLAIFHPASVSGSLVVPQIPTTAVTTSQRIGGSFAYSTIESGAVPSLALAALPSLPVQVQTTLPTASAVPLQSIFGGSFFNPIISSPFYPGIGGQAPIASYPVFGQGPILGQYPGAGQVPVAAPPQGVPQGPAPPPAGAVVDDDTVSVEAA